MAQVSQNEHTPHAHTDSNTHTNTQANAPAPSPHTRYPTLPYQVNTSGEASKSGVEPGADSLALCRYIAKECKYLKLVGLMTIGR